MCPLLKGWDVWCFPPLELNSRNITVLSSSSNEYGMQYSAILQYYAIHGYLYIQYGASLSLCVVYTYPAQKHRIEKCGAYIWRCAGNWIYIASLSFNRWICRHLHVFMIISSSSSITFSRNTTFSIYISFDCWDAPPCSALLCCQSYIINTYTYTEWPTERFAYRRVKSFIVSSDNGWKATRRILATFLLFISNVCIFIGKKKKTLKYELALCVIHFCVCVCVEISLWAWLFWKMDSATDF